MANFFNDNEDIRFLFDHLDLRRLAAGMEDGFRLAERYDFAPQDADDAVDNYRRILETLGALAGDVIAPTAGETDRVGNVLNEDGTVTYAPGIARAIERLGQADLMGFTLPYEYGGLNCPQLLYTMSNDILSRADASLMNIYGLQGIAETINAFAADEIKSAYLPDMAAGRKTGAMVLTEPDAGSDLQSAKVRAFQDGAGNWFVQGVKRFITNGCGSVLLVLARSEPDSIDGRGLSLYLVERGPWVKVRRLEEKLGIHGSPTCELFFDDAPAKLIGDRRRGLTVYVMSLMNGARVGIAAQSLGIAEAAYRIARTYAHKRRQFGKAIDEMPAVRELLVDMSVDLQAARALTYHAALCVDLEFAAQRGLERPDIDKAEAAPLKDEARKLKRYNALLTPMCKYYASEMSVRVANNAVAVLGGSGYMRDYAVERHLRDSRITTIYEGTSQMQVVAAVRGVTSGVANMVVTELLEREWPEAVAPLVARIREGLGMLDEALAFVSEQSVTDYVDLNGRRLVDMVCTLVIGALLCDQAATHDTGRAEAKHAVAERWLNTRLPEMRSQCELIRSGDRAVLTNFEALAGSLPIVES